MCSLSTRKKMERPLRNQQMALNYNHETSLRAQMREVQFTHLNSSQSSEYNPQLYFDSIFNPEFYN
jgi:hypothetical protein